MKWWNCWWNFTKECVLGFLALFYGSAILALMLFAVWKIGTWIIDILHLSVPWQ